MISRDMIWMREKRTRIYTSCLHKQTEVVFPTGYYADRLFYYGYKESKAKKARLAIQQNPILELH